MPIYTYINDETGEVKDVVQSMNEPHVYEENGVQWRRVFHVPHTSIDSKMDPFSSKEFVEKTGAKKGTIGDLQDLSREMSDKRAELNGGVDPIKQKKFEEYSKARGGRKHPEQKKGFESTYVKVDY